MCECPPKHWNLVFSFLAVAQLCSGDFPHVALWGMHALSRETAYSCSRSEHHPVWHFSEVKKDKLTFLTATVNCQLSLPPPLATMSPKPLCTFSAHHQLWLSLLRQGLWQGPCLFLVPAWGEKKAPSYGISFSSLCILGLHTSRCLLQATSWLKQGRSVRMVNYGLTSAGRWGAMENLPPDMIFAPE